MTALEPEHPSFDSLASVFHHTPDDFWYWCLTEGLRQAPWLADALPKRPALDAQETFTGRSEDAAMEQAFGFYQVCKERLRALGRTLTPETRVLDFGCGWGRITQVFLKDVHPWNLIGSDVLDRAIAHSRRAGIPFRLIKNDPLPPLPLPDASLDLVLSYSVFSHLSEDHALAWMKEFRRLLSPGGVVLATTRPRESLAAFARLRSSGTVPDFALGAAQAFPDAEATLRAYDAGEYCFSPTGGGPGLEGFYGETLIPLAYARRAYGPWFASVDLLDHLQHGRFDQNLLILQAPSAPEAEAKPAPAPVPAEPEDLPWTGERLVTSLRGPIALEHLHRYAVAAELVAGREVLDLASGEGYGSALLARRARRVVGVDLDAASISHARRKYGRPGLEFVEGRAECLPLEDASVDAVVSFETIEHVQDQASFLAEIRRCLRPAGLLVISSPDRVVYNAENPEPNPFHQQELDHGEFIGLLREHFRHVVSARQRHLQGSYLAPDVPDAPARFGHFQGDFTQCEYQDGVHRGIFSFAVCSNEPLTDRIPFGVYESDLDYSPDFQKELLRRYQRERPRLDQALSLRENVIGAVSELLTRSQAEVARLESERDALQASLGAANEHVRQLEGALSAEQAYARDLEGALAAERDHVRELERTLSEARLGRQRLEASFVGLRARWQTSLEDWRDSRDRAATFHQLPRAIRRALWRKLVSLRRTLTAAATGPVPGRWFSRALLPAVSTLKRRLVSGARWVRLVRESGLFDEPYYLAMHPEVSGSDPVRHYLAWGAEAGWDPNPYFATRIYLHRNPDVADQGYNPLVHFILFGADELRDPGPEFDTRFYLEQNPDVALAGVQAFPHFYFTGRHEGRSGRPDSAPDSALVSTALAFAPNTGEDSERRVRRVPTDWRTRTAPETGGLKTIAFYLPQYHPIPENDQWWGPGFTEWENVVRAEPLLPGHEQPHLPAELGFYDLRVPEVREHQAALARAYGLHGFCYYYYWFNGKKLLDRPLREVLASGRPDLPFCICWANENWTRRWDGQDEAILLEQHHTRDSDRDFFREVLPILQDPRYIRFEGKPVLLVYRVDALAEPAETAMAWRKQAVAAGLAGLHLCAVERYGFGDPRMRGFDALVEFPPNSYATRDLTRSVPGVHPGFRGKIADYLEMRQHSLDRPSAPFTLHRTVMTTWDNTPRLHLGGTVFTHATPEAYRAWLDGILAGTPHDREYLLFINAWNEWGEGAHLEPDLRHGFAFLEATSAALFAWAGAPAAGPRLAEPSAPVVSTPAEPKTASGAGWVLVVHDAHKHGAQFHALAIARELRRRHVPFSILLREGGDLESEFARTAETFNLQTEAKRYGSSGVALTRLARHFTAQGLGRCLGNTIVTGEVTAALKASGFQVLTLVNELPTLVDAYGLADQAHAAAAHSDVLVFPTEFVRRPFLAAYPADTARTVIRPQGVLRPNPYLGRRAWARAVLRRRLDLAPEQALVLTVGYGDLRKGPDLFAVVARQVLGQAGCGETAFVWAGRWALELESWVRHDLRCAGLDDRVRLVGFQEDDALFFAAADLFLLTSREDPFPNVMLSALEAGLPVVAFAGSGGAEEALAEDIGRLVPYLDTSAMASAVADLLRDPEARRALGERAAGRVRERFEFSAYVSDLLALLQEPGPSGGGKFGK